MLIVNDDYSWYLKIDFANMFMKYNEITKFMNISDKGTHHGNQRFYYPMLKDMLDKPITPVEIGVGYGKSMKIWKQLFRFPKHIFGISYKNHQTAYKEKVNDSLILFINY